MKKLQHFLQYDKEITTFSYIMMKKLLLLPHKNVPFFPWMLIGQSSLDSDCFPIIALPRTGSKNRLPGPLLPKMIVNIKAKIFWHQKYRVKLFRIFGKLVSESRHCMLVYACPLPLLYVNGNIFYGIWQYIYIYIYSSMYGSIEYTVLAV